MGLLNAPCMEVMRTMENGSVDLTPADMPYAEVPRAGLVHLPLRQARAAPCTEEYQPV